MVRYKNLKINGKEILKNQKIWYEKPFTYQLKNVLKSESVTLEFIISKPLSIHDCPLAIVMAAVFIFWGLLLIFSFLPKFLKQKLSSVFEKINQKDWLESFQKAYSAIDPVYRCSFWIIFATLCFAFGFHTICYMWGNHDWQYLIYDRRPWSNFAHLGRYGLNIVKESFLVNVYLPVIYDVVTFLFMALNGVLLGIYWRLEKRVAYFVLCGLILTAQPFTLSLIYYIHMIPETFIGVTLLLAGLLISEKVGFRETTLSKKLFYSLVSIVLFNLSLAMYPVLLNTIAVVFVGRILVRSFQWDGSWKHFKTCFIPFVPTALNIVLGILSYKLMLTFVFPVQEDYNTQTLPLEQLPDRFLVLLAQSIRQLCEYNYPFISQTVLYVFLVFTFVLALYICSGKNKKQNTLRLLLLWASLFATQISMLVANTHVVEARIELFGLVVYETLVAVLVFTMFQKIRNFSLAVFGLVVFVSIVNDLDCLRMWKLGFDAEQMLWNRVLVRLETTENFNPNLKYKIVQIGEPIAMRPKYYGKILEDFVGGAPGSLNFAYDASWDVFHAHEFYYPTDFRQRPSLLHPKNEEEYVAELKRLYQKGILDKLRAWPHQNSLIIVDDVIVYATDEKVLEKYKTQFLEELKDE